MAGSSHPGIMRMHPFEVLATAQREDDAHLYREIPTSLVRTGRAYDFDLFLRMHDKHRLFAARGVVLTRDHLSLMSREDTRFAVRCEDWPAVRKTLMRAPGPTRETPSPGPGAMADLIYASAIQSLRDTYRGAVPRTIVAAEPVAATAAAAVCDAGG